MRKIFLLLSVMLLFIGTALANAPPALDVGQNQTEFINYLPGDHLDLSGLAMDVIQFPADMQAFNLPTQNEATNIQNLTIPEVIDIGYDPFKINLYVNSQLNQDVIVLDTQINPYESRYTCLHEINDQSITGLSRLDIGEIQST